MIKYLGEQGIDTGALAREFFTAVISDMAHIIFPNGSPVHSTLFIKNGNFRAAGEIVAASLAQNSHAPSFLEEESYKMLLNLDLALMNLEAEQHLTPSEREQICRIREDVVNVQDIIIDHGYTGPINENKIDEIVGSIIISMVSRRSRSLGEFMEGRKAYGLKDLLISNPEA